MRSPTLISVRNGSFDGSAVATNALIGCGEVDDSSRLQSHRPLAAPDASMNESLSPPLRSREATKRSL